MDSSKLSKSSIQYSLTDDSHWFQSFSKTTWHYKKLWYNRDPLSFRKRPHAPSRLVCQGSPIVFRRVFFCERERNKGVSLTFKPSWMQSRPSVHWPQNPKRTNDVWTYFGPRLLWYWISWQRSTLWSIKRLSQRLVESPPKNIVFLLGCPNHNQAIFSYCNRL